jgi:hypothetical protein
MSPKASPLLGYNNNVRHKGKVFHIQTEDSGVRYSHVITHLFMDGGRILKSVKTSYAEYAASERRAEIVREMMKQQHKAMFMALREGTFDAIALGTGAPSSGIPSFPDPLSGPGAEAAAQADRISGLDGSAPPRLIPASHPLRSSSGSTALRSSSKLRAAMPLSSPVEPPPAAATLFPEAAPAGALRVTPAPATLAPPGEPPVSAPAARPAAGLSSQPRGLAHAERRYAPTRPASSFGQARPAQGKTIFGEDLLADKSLDEVILSYLSTDPVEKK